MRRILTSSVVGALLLLPLLLDGCSNDVDRALLLRRIPTEQLHFEPSRTGASLLTMTVPERFMGEATPEARYDMFYLFDPADTGNPQRGMAILEIHPNPRKYIPDSTVSDRLPGIIVGKEIIWDEGIDEAGGKRLFQRELLQQGIVRAHDGQSDLYLHAFVVGSDSALVELLTAAIESLAVDSSSTDR